MQPPQPSSRWLLALGALALSACGYGRSHGHHDGYQDDGGYFCGDIEQAVIDTDEILDVQAGDGAGVFIEYETGGVYHVTTSCDAAESGNCLWDILVTPLDGAPVLGLSPFDLERNDSLTLKRSEVRLVASTGGDFDGFSLRTEPGAGIRFDAFLDYGCANRYLFWVGDGALREGAPSNPVDLVPSAE